MAFEDEDGHIIASAVELEGIEIREARVKYYDLAEHEDVTKSDFFSNADQKVMVQWGLVAIRDGLVRLLNVDDETDDSENRGMCMPLACVIEIAYLTEDDQSKLVVLKNKSNEGDLN